MTRDIFRLNDRQLNRLALTGVSIGFILLLAALAAVLLSFRGNLRSAQLLRHTYQVTDQLASLNLELERSESGRRGYLLVPQPYRLQIYLDNSARVPDTLSRIGQLVRDNPRQVRALTEVRSLAQAELTELHQSMSLAGGGQLELARRTFEATSENSLIRHIRVITADMRATELRLLAQRGAELDHSLSIVQIFLAATAVLLLLAGGGTFLLMRSYTSSLSSARDRLHLLNNDLEGAVAERTSDLQRANDEIQRFAYIVSHDLRSPLVNVMGFTAELEVTNKSLADLIQRAEREAPQILDDDTRHASSDLPEAIGFIRSSTQKMDRLINAILKISREGRRTLTPEPLPMQRMIEEIVTAVEHRSTAADCAMEIEPGLPNIVSDRLAVEQILSNVVDNAIKYLRPDRAGKIEIRGRERAGRAIFEVQDNGRGIDPRDHERVFELFRRSGTQDTTGEGIGLAHVRALAYRLGGTVTVDSVLGQGAIFRLDLPVTYSEQGQ